MLENVLIRKRMLEYLEVLRGVKCHDVCNLLSNDSAKMCVCVVWGDENVYTYT